METLADRIAREGALNELDAVGWVIRLAKRIEGIHALGAVHGSISPECMQTAGVPRTSQGVLLETSRASTRALYHSPERVQGGGASQADDAWAVGLTLYTMLTGANPFAAASEGESRRKILGGTLSPLAVYDVGDDDLQRILDDLLIVDPVQRATNLGKLRKELEAWHPDPSARDLPALEDEDTTTDDDDDDPRTMLRPNDVEPLSPVQVVVRAPSASDEDEDDDEDAQTRMREMPPGVLFPAPGAAPHTKAQPRPAAGAGHPDDDLPPTARDRPLRDPDHGPGANARPQAAPMRPAAGARPQHVPAPVVVRPKPVTPQAIGHHGLPDFSDPATGHESTEIMPAPQMNPRLLAKAAAAVVPVVVDDDEDDDARTVLREAPLEEEEASAAAAAKRMREILSQGPPHPGGAAHPGGPPRQAPTVALSADMVPPFPLNPAGGGQDKHAATVALSADQLPPGLAALDAPHENTAPLAPYPFGKGPSDGPWGSGAPTAQPGFAGPPNAMGGGAPFGAPGATPPLRSPYESGPSGMQHNHSSGGQMAPGMGPQGQLAYRPSSSGKGVLVMVLVALLIVTAVGTYLFLRFVPL